MTDLRGALGDLERHRAGGLGQRAKGGGPGAERAESRVGRAHQRPEGEKPGPSTLMVMLRQMTPARLALALIPVVFVLCLGLWHLWPQGQREFTPEEAGATEFTTKGRRGTKLAEWPAPPERDGRGRTSGRPV